jgi:NAD(P)-dependent dehydrogenase (short-subunit alcohol dehydrogenase family)
MSKNPFDLTGKLALVTGGGTGIGFGISKCLVDAGALVVITGVQLPVDGGNAIGF